MSPIPDELEDLKEEVKTMTKQLVEHEVRFGNGREVMAEIKADLAALKPKAPDWLKLLAVAVTMLSLMLGGHYWLIEQFNDRPTTIQIEKAFHAHSEQGHADTRHDIGSLQDSVSDLRKTVSEVQQTVMRQGGKLDAILQRLPNKDR